MPTPDEVAALFKAAFDGADALIAAHEDGPLKRYVAKRVDGAHALLDDARQKIAGSGVVPMSGGEPKEF